MTQATDRFGLVKYENLVMAITHSGEALYTLLTDQGFLQLQARLLLLPLRRTAHLAIAKSGG